MPGTKERSSGQGKVERVVRDINDVGKIPHFLGNRERVTNKYHQEHHTL